ncbi:MAG: transcriptional regulator [Actinobacteria bacterium]|nr:transcriptional regulator [Actinomycetota bacterium]
MADGHCRWPDSRGDCPPWGILRWGRRREEWVKVVADTDYARALGERLRNIRGQKGMSLRDVEHASEGVWKAAVVGAYERGDRNVTVPRLYDLAAFYGVPLSEILPDSGPPPTGTSEEQRRVVLDLRKLQEVPDTQGDPLLRFAHTIQSLRGDFNGKILTVREDDLMALALAYQTTLDDLSHRFKDWGLVTDGDS